MIRIGDPAVHEGIFLGGITAMTSEAPNQAVLVDPTTGQLGSVDVGSLLEYAIVSVFVDRGSGPSRWATSIRSAPGGNDHGRSLPVLLLGRPGAVQDLLRGCGDLGPRRVMRWSTRGC